MPHCRKLTKALSLSPIPAKWTASASDGELMNYTCDNQFDYRHVKSKM
jgi:hypothetical protein